MSEKKMMTKYLSFCLFDGLTNGFLFDMDLNLHVGLEKGNTIPIGTGGYLRDSFRKQVLVPAFQSVEEELKSNRK